MLKRGPDPNTSMRRTGQNFTIGNMGLKMGGIDDGANNPFSVFLP